MRICIDCRYRPYFKVGELASTVDIDCDKSTGRLKSNRPIDNTCVQIERTHKLFVVIILVYVLSDNPPTHSNFECPTHSPEFSGRNRIWRWFRVFCLLSVKVCSWYKTHSNTGILAGVRYVFFLSVPGFQFGPVTVSFEAFSGHKTMMYTLKVGFTIVNNLIQHRGLDCHLIL